MRLIFCLAILLSLHTHAQLAVFSPIGDTGKRVTLEGYVDAYYAFDRQEPESKDRPYFVSHARHNEVSINLAYLSLRYTAERARATLTPGFGTYMNTNYAAERGSLRNLVEANAGFRLSKKGIWLDVGVLPSPYTNETALSFDHLVLTRSFAPEYVPYYLAGAKLTVPVSKTMTAYGYVLNGWQQIEDQNSSLSFGSQLEWRPTEKLLVNWNTYVGDERSAFTPMNRTRYFSDVYAVWYPTARWAFTACLYAGLQKVVDTLTGTTMRNSWGQGNVIARYSWNAQSSISARAEYFRDPTEVMLRPVANLAATSRIGFRCFSATLGYNHAISRNVLARAEGRYFSSADPLFFREGAATRNNFVFTTGVAAKF